MKCPHRPNLFVEKWEEYEFGVDNDERWQLAHCHCAGCKKIIIELRRCVTTKYTPIMGSRGRGVPHEEMSEFLVWPRRIARTPLPQEVPEEYKSDYGEACLVLADSPRASAALSRRCLQRLLREVAKVKPTNLAAEIEEVIKSLPSHLAQEIDAIRNVGNFAAHPAKIRNTGEIVDVEPGEAEWSLDALKGLFDFYFVQPEILKKKRAALDAKLKDAGKPKMR